MATGSETPTARPAGVTRAGRTGSEFFTGARLLGRGFGMYATNPRLLLLGLIPAVISLLLVTAGLVALIFFLDEFAELVTWFADDWASTPRRIMRWTAQAAILVTAGVVAIFTYTALTLIIGDPFYEVISKRVEEREGGKAGDVDVPWHRSLRWNAADSVRLLLLSLTLSVPLFLLGFIPVVGQTVVPVLNATVGGWLLAVELTGIPFNRRGLRLADRRRVLRGNRTLALGFGIPVFLLMLVPFVGVFVIPAAVAGSTLLTRRVLGDER